MNKWCFVERRFRRFLYNIEPTPLQHEDVATKVVGIINCLNRKYWYNLLSQGYTSFVMGGSWAKGTRVRTSSDMDIIFLLPWSVYHRFENRLGNRQSYILQEVKEVLMVSYPETVIRSDGPVIVMNFSTYKVEIVPAFRDADSPADIENQDFKVFICDTNNNGRYKLCAPTAERNKVIQSNTAWGGNLVSLIRMVKIWKRNCSVPIKSFYIEQLGLEFLGIWMFTGRSEFWNDWMVRDFFLYILSRVGGCNVLPGANEIFCYGHEWATKAESALKAASRACLYEELNLNELAGEEWQKIFGTNIPRVA